MKKIVNNTNDRFKQMEERMKTMFTNLKVQIEQLTKAWNFRNEEAIRENT